MEHQDHEQPERLYIVSNENRGPALAFITSLPPERWHELQEQERRRMDEYDRQHYGQDFVDRYYAHLDNGNVATDGPPANNPAT